jgi:hypothetical protein
MVLAKISTPPPRREWLRLARKRNLRTLAATHQPGGQITQNSVNPRRGKYSAFPKSQIRLYRPPSRSTGGAFRDRHKRGAGCGGRGSVGRARRSQGGLLSVSGLRHAGRTALISAFARVRRTGTGSGEASGRDGPRTAKSCGPDASVLASSRWRFCGARPGFKKPQSADDGDNKPITGEITYKP